MNVTPAERRGFRAKTTSRTPLAWLLFLFVLFSFLIFLFCPPCPSIPAVLHLTHDAALYMALQDAFSRSSSPYAFSISARRRRVSATSRGTSLETRVCSCAGGRKSPGSLNEIVCAARTPCRHRFDPPPIRLVSAVS